MVTCHDVEPRLSEFVDDTLTDGERATIAAHVATCADCRGRAEDLRRLRAAARTLGTMMPPSDVWRRIAAGIEADTQGVRPRVDTAPRDGTIWIRIAAAIVILAASAYLIVRLSRPETPAQIAQASNATAAGSVELLSDELKRTEANYDTAIAQMEAIVTSGDAAIDPTVSSVLQKNLPVMDRAIAESRAALKEAPDSAAARESLFDALGRKAGVLQDTVALMGAMRDTSER
jgi:hypothetical protein